MVFFSKASTCIQICAVAGFGIEYDTIWLSLSAPGNLSLFLRRIRRQTGQEGKKKTQHPKSAKWNLSKFTAKYLKENILFLFFTWWTRKANLTPWTISSSSSGPPSTASSSADTLFMYFIANFTDASLICDKNVRQLSVQSFS